VQGRDEGNDVVFLQLIFQLAHQFPIGVVDQHQNAGANLQQEMMRLSSEVDLHLALDNVENVDCWCQL
jgi:hypothetical protein